MLTSKHTHSWLVKLAAELNYANKKISVLDDCIFITCKESDVNNNLFYPNDVMLKYKI